METREGTVAHLQNTVSVSGGGTNSRATTTYIALFRLSGEPVQFRCGGPIPFAVGDRLKVAGRQRATDFYAYACRDLTTGAILSAGVWVNVVMAVILPLFGLFFCGIASLMIGKFAVGLYTLFLAGAVYLIVNAVRTSQALKLVREP